MQTESVNVCVESEYLPDQSNPEESLFAFAYHVTITNNTDQTIRLIDRKWIITDANGIVNEVEGKGVIGEQPVLQSGYSHHYSSGAILKTPFGCMQGHYGMRTEDGDKFNAKIPVFTLTVPGLIN